MAHVRTHRRVPVTALTLAALAALLRPLPAAAGIPLVSPPEGAIVVNFDDLASAPTSFGDTLALRTRYAAVGVNFSAPGNNGGAVLAENGGFGISGFSPPNILAFNVAGTLSGGGTPQLPQTLLFRRAVSYVQFNVGDTSGISITAEAFDADNNSLGSQGVVPASAMQTIVLEARHIAKVVITGGGLTTIIDDLAFVLDSTVLDFDEEAAPSAFNMAEAVYNDYAGKGVLFRKIEPDDGGAILDQAAGINVTGFSPPNYLAFDSAQSLKFGGMPALPQFILFNPPVRRIEFLVGDPDGSTFHAEARSWFDEIVDETSVETGVAMQKVVLDGPGITTLILTSDGTKAVIDDFEYLIEGTLIDFDDDTNPPVIFNEATAIRNRYEALGVKFTAPGNDGPALLSTGSLGVTGFSGTNFLAFDAGDQLANGAIPKLPLTLDFDRPLKRVEFRVGSNAGTRVFIEALDAVGGLMATNDLITTPQLQTLNLYFDGITRLNVTTNGSVGVIDDLAFTFVDPCAFDICYQGGELNRYCSVCVTQICAENSDCCNDGWTLDCAEAAEELCDLPCGPLCGDANEDRKVSAPDALSALKTAVGTDDCPGYLCDFNGADGVKSGDALLILKTGVGQPTTPQCPPPPF